MRSMTEGLSVGGAICFIENRTFLSLPSRSARHLPFPKGEAVFVCPLQKAPFPNSREGRFCASALAFCGMFPTDRPKNSILGGFDDAPAQTFFAAVEDGILPFGHGALLFREGDMQSAAA